MKKYLLLWLPMTLAAIVITAIALKLASSDSASTFGYLNADAEAESVTEFAEDGAAGEAGEGRAVHGTNEDQVSPLLVEPTSEARRLKEVFDYSLSVVEGFEEIAVEGGWSYDEQCCDLAILV